MGPAVVGIAVVAARAVVAVAAAVPVPVAPELVPAEGCTLERLRPGGVASDMMLVEGLSGANAAGGAMLTAPELVAVIVVVVAPVATALVAVVVEVVLGAGVVVGMGIAPEIAAGWVPGGDGGGAAVVVEDVEVVVEVVVVCANAEPAAPASSAAARVRVAGLSVICARSSGAARANDRR